MIEEIGVITAVQKDRIWVETEIKTTCGSCAAQDNCGTGLVAKALANKKELLILPCQEQACVGQKVRLGIPENHLLSASAMVYLLPLVVLLISALLGQWLLPILSLQSELWIIGFSGFSTYLCFRWVKKVLSTQVEQRYQPQLLALLPDKQINIDIV